MLVQALCYTVEHAYRIRTDILRTFGTTSINKNGNLMTSAVNVLDAPFPGLNLRKRIQDARHGEVLARSCAG